MSALKPVWRQRQKSENEVESSMPRGVDVGLYVLVPDLGGGDSRVSKRLMSLDTAIGMILVWRSEFK